MIQDVQFVHLPIVANNAIVTTSYLEAVVQKKLAVAIQVYFRQQAKNEADLYMILIMNFKFSSIKLSLYHL